MSEFNHPHVLTLMGVAIDKEFGLPILVMPYMPNGDLNSYLRLFRYDPDFFDKKAIPVSSICAPQPVSGFHKILNYIASMRNY